VPRRRFQQGHLKVIGKKWVLFYWMDISVDGIVKRVKRSARLGETKDLSSRAARRAAQPILDSVNNQVEVPEVRMDRGISLEEFLPEWRKGAALALKPSTRHGMEGTVRVHSLPVLGDVPLTAMNTKKIQELISSMEGRSRKTCMNVVMDLFSILTAARKWGHAVPTVKFSDLYFPVKQPREAVYYTPEQLTAILAAFASREPWDMFFTLLANTGLRTSEILGLRVADLDFTKGLIHVSQSVWKGKVQTLKNESSKSTVPMTKAMRVKLEKYLLTHNHELLFVNQIGRPLDGNKIVPRILHPILDKLCLPRAGLHAFRHSLASILLQTTGVAVAQRQMRHSDPRTTVGIYGHVLGNDHLNAMEAIQTVLNGTSTIEATAK
jgi:integrase